MAVQTRAGGPKACRLSQNKSWPSKGKRLGRAGLPLCSRWELFSWVALRCAALSASASGLDALGSWASLALAAAGAWLLKEELAGGARSLAQGRQHFLLAARSTQNPARAGRYRRRRSRIRSQTQSLGVMLGQRWGCGGVRGDAGPALRREDAEIAGAAAHRKATRRSHRLGPAAHLAQVPPQGPQQRP